MLCEFGARIAQLSARMRGSSYCPARSHGSKRCPERKGDLEGDAARGGDDRTAADQGERLSAGEGHLGHSI
jgi:hypothetical protein